MKKNATIFFEQTHGHQTQWLNKNEITKLLEDYNEMGHHHETDINPWVLTILTLIFLAGTIIGYMIAIS